MPDTKKNLIGFPPIADEECEILVLGSMPSVASLEQQQYYGHKQNYFWPMMFQIFEEPYSADYEDKKALLLKHHIALWDVIATCQREGSLDSHISDEMPNPIDDFLKQYARIKFILFNGNKAKQIFCRYFKILYDPDTCFLMPSTSPAHTLSRSEKLQQWLIIKGLLDEHKEENINDQ